MGRLYSSKLKTIMKDSVREDVENSYLFYLKVNSKQYV